MSTNPEALTHSKFIVLFGSICFALIIGLFCLAHYSDNKRAEYSASQATWEASLSQEDVNHIEQMRSAFKKTVSGTTVRYIVGNKECIGLARGAVNINNNSFSIKTFRDQNIPTGRMLTKSFLLTVSDVRHPDMNDAVWKDMVAQFELQKKCT
ncbi:hypothetical protein ACFL22_00505 [Patescibacteria group bacterium]